MNHVIFRQLFFSFLLLLGVKSFAQHPDLPEVKQVYFKADTFNITDFGAIAGGFDQNTGAINNAIQACTDNGGGIVVIPEGVWLSGPIVLKSNVNLHLKKNAVLIFTRDFDQYPIVRSDWEGVPQMRNQSPISARDVENIAITGHGVIDGNGDAWRMVKKGKMTSSQWKNLINSGGVLSEDKKTWYPTEKSLAGSKIKNPGFYSEERDRNFYESIKDFLRPNMISIQRSKRILLEGVTFQNSAAWNIHPLLCEDLTIRNIFARNPWYSQNGDGLDIESCKNVLVEDSKFDVGDDGICIKSGRDEPGRKRGVPTENVMIRNNVVYHGHGGFVVGSEMSGGARNIYVENCTFIGTDIGLRFKTTRGRGGIVENIFINNIMMKDIPGEALLFDMYYEAVDPIPQAGENRVAPRVITYPVTEETPQFRKFYINNVQVDGAKTAVFVRGLPEMDIQDIHISNFEAQSDKGIEITEGKNISFSNIRLKTKNTNPLVRIHNGKDVSFDSFDVEPDAQLVFDISGEQTNNIEVKNSDFSHARRTADFGDGASKKALNKK